MLVCTLSTNVVNLTLKSNNNLIFEKETTHNLVYKYLNVELSKIYNLKSH